MNKLLIIPIILFILVIITVIISVIILGTILYFKNKSYDTNLLIDVKIDKSNDYLKLSKILPLNNKLAEQIFYDLQKIDDKIISVLNIDDKNNRYLKYEIILSDKFEMYLFINSLIDKLKKYNITTMNYEGNVYKKQIKNNYPTNYVDKFEIKDLNLNILYIDDVDDYKESYDNIYSNVYFQKPKKIKYLTIIFINENTNLSKKIVYPIYTDIGYKVVMEAIEGILEPYKGLIAIDNKGDQCIYYKLKFQDAELLNQAYNKINDKIKNKLHCLIVNCDGKNYVYETDDAVIFNTYLFMIENETGKKLEKIKNYSEYDIYYMYSDIIPATKD